AQGRGRPAAALLCPRAIAADPSPNASLQTPRQHHVAVADCLGTVGRQHPQPTMPSRLAGSPNAARMAEYSAAQLQAAGVAARIENIPGLVSFPREAELVVVSPEQKMLAANTFGHSPQTLPEGVCGDLVYVGSGHFSDYEEKDVAGKITLSELSYSHGRHEKQRIAALMGS